MSDLPPPVAPALPEGAIPSLPRAAPRAAPRLGARAALLAAATRARRALELRYGGAWRVVHPHALGRTSRGRLALLAWQTAGGQPGRMEGWRLFDLTRIEAVEPLHAAFTPRPPGNGGRAPVIRRPMEAV
jgi:predicted DNA-binding transcriptional regulator YafY